MPAYELNEHTVTVLHSLMRRNEQKEKDTQLLVEDLRQKADEYNAEGTVLAHKAQKKQTTKLCVQIDSQNI